MRHIKAERFLIGAPQADHTGRYSTARSNRMHSDSRGKGDAVPLIHGMPTNGRLWDGVVRELSRRHKCIVIELRGMGNTPFLSYGPCYFAQMAAQIEQIRRRYRVHRWHVVGHDGGSAIGVQYAHLIPRRVDCLALLSPAVFSTCSRSFCSTCSASPFWANFLRRSSIRCSGVS